MLESDATVTEIEMLESGGFWLQAAIIVPENIFSAQLILDKFGSDAKSCPLTNLFAGTHNLTVEGSGHPPVGVGDTIRAICFEEGESKELDNIRWAAEGGHGSPGSC